MNTERRAAEPPDTPGKNQQFAFLNSMRRERTLLDVYLVNGTRLRGRIRSFDQYSMIIETGQGDAFLYHHTVSSVGRAQGNQRTGARKPTGPGTFRSESGAPVDRDERSPVEPREGRDLTPPREPGFRRPAPRPDGSEGPVVVRKISRRIDPDAQR